MRIRYLLVLPELVLLYFFVAPIFKHICNPGNLFGILACLVLLFITIFPEKFWHLMLLIWQSVIGKIGLSLLSLALVAGIAFSTVMSVQMVRALSNTPTEPTTVVVLGCKVRGETPSLMLTRRLKTAREYLLDHPEVTCIVTGGQGLGEDIPEGQAMANWLVEHDIPAERILIEDESKDTQENLRNTAAILEEQGLSNEIIIVTDEFHQYRASLLAEKEGLSSTAYSAKTRALFVPTYWVREWMALFQLFVFGHG